VKISFKNFLTESDAFTEVVADLKNDPYKDNEKPKTEKAEKLPTWQKVFDPVKWRKYLQLASASNN
jgi:hypothetical protein